jgi:hypothetical protein
MNNIHIEKSYFNINFTFYNFLKILNSNDGLSSSQINKTYELINDSSDYESFINSFKKIILIKIKSESKIIILNELVFNINSEINYNLFVFAIYLLKFKPILMEYSKLIEETTILQNVPLLSLERDNFTKNKPFAFRVNGALISLIFFDFIEKKEKEHFPTSDYSDNFINDLFNIYKDLKLEGLEANQIFMILFQESISQSIKSTAGSGLEDYVVTLLSNEKILDVNKRIDSNNHEIEYDHFFTLKNKNYGISTKRTLRERYKQFKKNPDAEADIFIHITSGLDLNAEKAKTITSNSFGCYIFVFPEIYEKSQFMIDNNKIFSTLELTKKKLLTLI